MKPKGAIAAVLALAALLPALAAGRAACCAPKAAEVKPACCPAMAARAAVAKNCCKAPAAPKPMAKANERAPLGTVSSPAPTVAPAAAVASIPSATGVRLARLAHRAECPDDSPPDRLTRNSALLI